MSYVLLQNKYYRLLRIDNLTGTWLLLLPCWYGVVMAFKNVLFCMYWLIIFAYGAMIMRSAGCIINDIVDRKIDSGVARTNKRPLASGEVTIQQALILLSILLLMAACTLFFFNRLAVILSLFYMVVVIIYPFTKRYCKYPQTILGIAFNSGIFIAWAAITNKIDLTAVFLYIGSIFWTIYYDTIYAHQDKCDDLVLGLHSTAISFGKNNYKYLRLCYIITGLFWTLAGVVNNNNMAYFITLVVIIGVIHKQLCTIDLDSKASCANAFQEHQRIGFTLFFGMLYSQLL